MQRLPKVCVGVALAAGLLGTHLYLAAQNSATSGEFQVTDAGAASYTVPIYAAPGTGNLDVKLALQYNSQSSNGVFGQGWSLTGVSAITRCPKTHAEEGDRVGVKNDATDVFCLDGQKLRSVSGTYGAAGTVYRTARESYSQITSNGVQGTGPQNFVVQTKSGLVMQFGATLDSRLEHPTTGTARVWMVNQIKDRFGNPINFTYTKSTALGEQLLQTVRYSNGQVKLVYEARPANDKIIKFDNGVQFGSTDSRVSKIEIYEEPVVSGARQLRLFKDYRMTYVQSGATRRSLLTNIQECAANGNCLPKMTMAYQNTQPASYVGTSAGIDAGFPGYVVDTLGKGKQSIYSLTKVSALVGYTSYSLSSAVAWDIDGDSKTDFHTIYQDPLGNTFNDQSHLLLSTTGITSGAISEVPSCYIDSNGDGVSEKFRFESKGGNSQTDALAKMYLIGTLNNFSEAVVPIFDVDRPLNCQAVDIDGDGRSDIYVDNAAGVFTYQAGQLVSTNLRAPANALSQYRPSTVGDFNGDGKTDLFLQRTPASGNTLGVVYSNGAFETWGPSWTQGFSGGQLAGGTYCIGDFNGDGRSDIFNSIGSILLLSNGNSFTEITTNIPSQGSNVMCGDFNGDGLTDVFVNGQYYWSSTPGAVDTLKEVNNGLGHIHKVEYKSITDDTIYTKLSGAAYPQVDLQTPIQVVVRAQSGNDSQGYNATTYRYEGLRADLKRRGTLGFQKVTSRNETTGISMATTYHQADPLIGLKQRSVKYAGTASAPQVLEDISYTYGPRGLAGAGSASNVLYAQVPITGMTTLRNELGSGAFIAAVSDDFSSIDPYGNVLTHSMVQFDNGSVAVSGKTTTNEYTVDTGRWLVGQLTKSSVRSRNLRALPATTVGSAANAGSQTGIPSLTVSASPNPITVQRNNPGIVTAAASALASGGVPAYTYQWTVPSGSRVTISSPSSAATNLNANLTWGETVNEVAQLRVTDQAGVVRTVNVNVQLKVPAALTVAVSPNTLSAQRPDPGSLSVSTSVSAAGGTGGYSFNWTKLTGTRISITNATSANPTFSANMSWNDTVTESASVTVTDSAGNVVTGDVNISFKTPAPTPLVASVLPTSFVVSRNNPGPISQPASAVVSGGTGGNVYSWTKLTGSRISIINPSSTGPNFYADMGWGENFSENARLTVTDNSGQTAVKDIVLNFSTPAQLLSSVNPSSFTLSRNNPGPLSRAVSASASGGTGVYSYSWSKLSGSRISIINQTTANPTFYADLGWSENSIESARLTVTDSAGNVTYTDISMGISSPSQLIANGSPTNGAFVSQVCAPVTFNATVTAGGGVPGYTYTWQTLSAGLGQASYVSISANTAVIQIVPPNAVGPQPLAYVVRVVDAAGNEVTVNGFVQYASCFDSSGRAAPPTTTPKQ